MEKNLKFWLVILIILLTVGLLFLPKTAVANPVPIPLPDLTIQPSDIFFSSKTITDDTEDEQFRKVFEDDLTQIANQMDKIENIKSGSDLFNSTVIEIEYTPGLSDMEKIFLQGQVQYQLEPKWYTEYVERNNIYVIYIYPTPEPPWPGFVIGELIVGFNKSTKDFTEIKAYVHNIGESNAKNVALRFFNGDPTTGVQISQNQMIQDIPSEGSESTLVYWDTAKLNGFYDIHVEADPENIIAESDETNNKAHRSIGLPLDETTKAYQHLNEVMDKFHNSFDVYTDLSAAGNHFIYLARMVGVGNPGAVENNPASTEAAHSGATSIKGSFKAQDLDWGGWYFLNGVLEGEEITPKANWGDYPKAGFDLTGTTKLTFWARGEKGRERVEFFVGGVGWKADYQGRSLYPEKPYADSLPKVSTGYIILSSEWQKYTINLQGYDLSYVIGGFGWVTNASRNNNQDITFYLDDIQYDKTHLNEPRFLLSFETIPSNNDFDQIMKNVAFVYDNALALLAYIARGNSNDWQRAKLLADTLVYVQNNDRYFTDGRLRNAYQAGDLVLFPGWKPHGKEATVRMPGWWNEQEKKWFEDKIQVGTHTGNLAWAMIALLTYYENKGGQEYLQAVEKMGEWIEQNTLDSRGDGGYTGGYEGWEQTTNNPNGQTKLLWKSTEHNLDLYVVFTRLYQATRDSKWQERANHAKKFVEAMWNSQKGHFWTGTLEDGMTINTTAIPLDAQTWTILAFLNFPEKEKYQQAISWAEQSTVASFEFPDFKFEGFDFNTDRDMPWAEGTAQMVVALEKIGESGKAQYYLTELEELQKLASNTNGKGIVAAPADGLTTGFDWLYHNRLHVGATAWFIFAEQGYNPLKVLIDVKVDLYKGWNLVALPINPSIPLTAQSLLDLINSQGGDATQIVKWNPETQSWITHINNIPINNFEIKPGEGYFIKSNKNSEVTLTGNLINSPVPISFYKNWNLIGIPYPVNKYTAQTLLDEINKQGGDAALIVKWNAETQSWITHINNVPINDFKIKPDEGYFIKTGKASEFVPN